MVKNTDTFAPSLTICPEYFISYNETNMNKIGIQNANEYRLGNWYGNSTLDGGTIFKSVTHNFSDLVTNVTIHLENGEEVTFTKFDNLTVTEKGYATLGRCFEINPLNKGERVQSLGIHFSKSIYIYFNIPNQFYYIDTKYKLEANFGESLYLDITYDILKKTRLPASRSSSIGPEGRFLFLHPKVKVKERIFLRSIVKEPLFGI